jgi:hypothetical protein
LNRVPTFPAGRQQAIARFLTRYSTVIAGRSDLFESITAFAGPFIVNSTASGSAERAKTEMVSGSFFKTLGIAAARLGDRCKNPMTT